MIDDLLDRLDSGETLDKSMVDRFVEALKPGDGDQWPELESLLRVAEHPALADELRRHDLPARLEAALAEALDAVLPMLGVSSYGPTYKLADIARRELRRERKKRDAVVDKLDAMDVTGADRDRAEKILGRYVDTEPAPMFLNEIRTLYPDVVAAARGGFDELDAFRSALERAPLLDEALSAPTEADAARVHEALAQLEGELEVDDRQIGLAFEADEPVVARLAAGIALIRDDRQLGTRAAHAVSGGSAAAPTLAVVSGVIAPRVARTVFSQMVAEATWQNPELPDAELTRNRVRAILSARLVLPHVGSPMEPLPAESLPEMVPDDLEDLPDRIDQLWQFWHDVAAGGDAS